MMDKKTFNQWMDEFFDSKFNQLRYSNTRYPKRMEKVTLDLSVAPSQPVKIPIPFRSMLVSRIYSTSVTATDKAGSISVMFDYDNLMNQSNAIQLFTNDSFSLDTEVASGFLTWSAQADTTIQLYFFVDIDYKTGSTKTSIVGSVNITASSPLGIKQVPSSTTQIVAVNTSSSYTIPAGFYAHVSAWGNNYSAQDAWIRVNGVDMGHVSGSSTTGSAVSFNGWVVAGDIVLVGSSGTTASTSANITKYPI
jgi:hypothetical protein